LAFFGTFTYAIGFVGNLLVPKSIDSGEPGPLGFSILVNAVLLMVFVVQHTIMARPAFKREWTKIVPQPIERGTFVLAASLALMLIFWQWRPIPTLVWDIQQPIARTILWTLYLSGYGLVLFSSFLIDHFDLFGLRQVYFHFTGREYHHPPFIERSIYRRIRHPLMAGFLIAFWCTPTMSQGHLLFAVLSTGYIFFGIAVEERDLLQILGPDYRAYRERTPMILPLGKKKGREREARETAR